MQPNRGDEPEGQHLSDPRHRQYYKFSPEEVRVIKECNRESFYQRCLPLGAILGVSTYYGVKAGYLRGNPRFGAFPKVTVSVIVGYFLGKFSYQTKCAEKLMQLPNSQIGEMLRRRRQGTFQESLEPGFGPGMSLGPFSGISSSDTYTDLGPGNSVDIDTSRPQFDGLDDAQRPSIDNPIYEEEMPPVQKQVTTYDELRKKNREEYQQKRTLSYREPAKSAPPPSPGPTTPSDVSEGIKNKYGDVWG
ncbi:OCIA domain-containing protein 1 [Tribolium castaneum]|uniref:OCIA domain-containing protein 1-like Protein n=1 Tax=Tribolium castaneum TaxID=7070 RepID=D6WFH5_TRICA|nr:PREDICTED: OCIA domain-containing protein 1 [Tribolium castaneum]EEZ99819.1 OCIA domain-containing protein 1-like Protein [Tribolium castaneum]|eukprot:XP_968044.1 PREDICTED: OCIA domain-containing protein 1 [Tribolium castaneum]